MNRVGNGAEGLRVVVADRHPIVIDGIAALLACGGHRVVARGRTGDEAADAAESDNVDLAILDIELTARSTLEVLGNLRVRRPSLRIIVTAPSADNGDLLEAIEAGVDGVVLKTDESEALDRCVSTVGAGGRWLDRTVTLLTLDRTAGIHLPLTPRERDVTRLVATGQRNRGIASALGITEGTVKMHLHNVYSKLGIESRTQLAMDGRIRRMA